MLFPFRRPMPSLSAESFFHADGFERFSRFRGDTEPFSGIFLPFRWALNASAFWEADARPFGDLLVAAVGDGSVSGLKSNAKVMKLPDC